MIITPRKLKACVKQTKGKINTSYLFIIFNLTFFLLFFSLQQQIEELSQTLGAKGKEIVDLAAKVSGLEKDLLEQEQVLASAQSNSEESFKQRILDSEKQVADLTKKCKLFEKQIEISEEVRKNESKEAVGASEAAENVKKELERRIRDLEDERKRLQNETDALESAASISAAHRKVCIRFFLLCFFYFN